jgi:hypothetical protein
MDSKTAQHICDYVNAIETTKSQRKRTLSEAGLTLRTTFGISGKELKSFLSKINRVRIVPPLLDGTVVRIAHSIDEQMERKADCKPNRIICLNFDTYALNGKSLDLKKLLDAVQADCEPS